MSYICAYWGDWTPWDNGTVESDTTEPTRSETNSAPMSFEDLIREERNISDAYKKAVKDSEQRKEEKVAKEINKFEKQY